MNRVEALKKVEELMHDMNNDGLVFMYQLAESIRENEKYNINTPLERIEQIKETGAKNRAIEEEARRAAIEERRTFESTFIYDRNDTMKLLGKQETYFFLGLDTEPGQQFNEIKEAHRYDFNYNLALDAFSLGIIWGKRTERAKRKGEVKWFTR